MNHFETTILGRLLEPALSLRLTLTLLHFLWQGALLGLAAFAADRVLSGASSRTRYAAFVGILAAMGAALPTTFLLIRIAEPQQQSRHRTRADVRTGRDDELVAGCHAAADWQSPAAGRHHSGQTT